MDTLSRRRLTLPLCGLILVLALCAAPAHALVLVRDGKPLATIVIAADAGEKVKTAAADLQQYLKKMSGAEIPLRTDADQLTGPLVLVGASKLTQPLPVSIPSGVTTTRREEGFVIWCRGDRLVLAGNNDGPYHGTEYAVYELLNRLGVRWFMPGDFGEIVPHRATITVAAMQITQTPDFVMRDWWLHAKPELAAQEKRWKLRNKMNPERDFFHLPADSSVRNIVRPELFKDKPELFALNADGTRNPHLPNLSNPGAVTVAAEIIKQFFREHPTANSYGFAPDDGMPRDYNPETVKLNLGFPEVLGRPGVPAEVSTSEEWFRFVNQVTAEVRRDFPQVYIATNGYANRDIPPQGLKLDDHLVVMFAAIWSCTLHGYDDCHCWQKVRQGQMLQRWAAMCPNVWVYGYNYQMLVSGLTPLPEFTKLRRDFPLMRKWGVMGFLDENRNVWAEAGIASRYLRARLEWDADADVDDILNDFFRCWYGPAAQPMQDFSCGLDRAIADSTVHGHEDRCLPDLYTPDLMAMLAAELGKAERLATAEPYRTRVRSDRLILEHLRAYVAMSQADLSGDFARAAREAGRMLELRGPLHQISPFFIWPDEAGYHTGVWYWKVSDRRAFYQDLADKLSGKQGDAVAPLPLIAGFSLDPHDEGLTAGWYEPGNRTAKWRPLRTDIPFYRQGYMDGAGRPYVGNLWYRFRVRVPAVTPGRPVRLYVPNLTTEGWCWVNGQFVGYRPFLDAYIRPSAMEAEVTQAIRPGAMNDIVLRVNTSLAEAQAAEGLYSRAFLYSPR